MITAHAASPLLLVIDMQNGFLGPSSAQLIAPVLRLLQRWRERTAFTRFVRLPGGQYERPIGWHRLQQPPETDLHSAVVTFAGRVFTKHCYSAFTDEFSAFADAADHKGVDASHGGDAAHDAGLLLLERFIGKTQLIDVAGALSLKTR